jgi:hypothetical protein
MRLVLLLLVSSFALGDNTQEGSLNTNAENSTVGSNNNSESSTTNYNGAGASSEIPVGSAITPSYMSNGVETCLQGSGSSIQTGMLGLSSGGFKEDPNCNRRRDSKVLSDLGMKVAAVARMCADNKVWESMFISGTPCPILTRGNLIVGKRAYLMMKSNPELYIPNYGKVKNGKKQRRVCDKKKTYLKCPIKSEHVSKPQFTAKQLWYNALLGIGEENVEQEDSSDGMSISERFRTSE